MKCGLLGEKLSHSYSPEIHKHLGDYSYDLVEVAPERLESFLAENPYHGLNVTIPYKKAVVPYCSALSPIAKRLGAVNTLVRQADGSWMGHNTDYFGFQSMVAKANLSLNGKKVLILGSGGACATVRAVVEDAQAFPVVISRSGENNYGNLHLHKDAAVIVNTTPVGMYPNTQNAPLDLSLFPNLEGVFDLIYNPARTRLLLQAQQRGLVTENGLWMLVAQAKESAQWFTNTTIEDAVIAPVYRQLQKGQKNIVLIGMPGCGKSTLGKQLALVTGKRFVDADEEIVSLANKTIPEIFAQDGETVFRDLEQRVLSRLGAQSGLVIATGGGCVTRPENYPFLAQNATIYWLQRSICKLPTQGRPLSQMTDLQLMYQKREPLYQAFADIVVSNDESVRQAVESIIHWEEMQ